MPVLFTYTHWFLAEIITIITKYYISSCHKMFNAKMAHNEGTEHLITLSSHLFTHKLTSDLKCYYDTANIITTFNIQKHVKCTYI
jgi:hypothetical protein